jgi:hypothetical protein
MLWLACEAAIIACDLAEVIGTAIALQLLFGIPLIGGALITAADAFLLLLADEQGLPLPRSFRHRAADRHRRLFRSSRSRAAAPPIAEVLNGFLPSTEVVTNPPCSTSPSASSAPPSCRITSTCIPRSCRPAPTSAPTKASAMRSNGRPPTAPSR